MRIDVKNYFDTESKDYDDVDQLDCHDEHGAADALGYNPVEDDLNNFAAEMDMVSVVGIL